MSAPSFSADYPLANQDNDIWDYEESGNADDVICRVSGTVDPGDDYTLAGIYLHDTSAPLTGSQAENEQTVRDAQREGVRTGMNWTYNKSLPAIRGQTNYFHAIADFSPLSEDDPYITIPFLNRTWTPNLVSACAEAAPVPPDNPPPAVMVARKARATSETAPTNEAPKSDCECTGAALARGLSLVTRVVDVRPIEEMSDDGLWLRYILFNKNALNGNRLMLADGVTPLRASTIAIAATGVEWRASIKRNQVHQRPEGLNDTSHTETGPGGSPIAMRFPGRRKFSLGVVQYPPSGSGFSHQVITSRSRSNPNLANLELNADVLIQHNSNLFNIYGHTIQGAIEVCVKIEA